MEKLNKYHAATFNHCMRVSHLAFQVAGKAGFSSDLFILAIRAGLLYDYGKLYVPLEILTKLSSLTKDEYDIVNTHATHGALALHGLVMTPESLMPI